MDQPTVVPNSTAEKPVQCTILVQVEYVCDWYAYLIGHLHETTFSVNMCVTVDDCVAATVTV